MSEKCDRCGSTGQDRRTLHMACFYAMEELGILLGREILFDADTADLEKVSDPVAIDLPGDPAHGKPTLQAGTVRCKGELRPQGLYTLRVCKRCRGEWMAAIKEWFSAIPDGEDYDADEPPSRDAGPGTGIFVREHGAIKEITLEEWARRAKAKELR